MNPTNIRINGIKAANPAELRHALFSLSDSNTNYGQNNSETVVNRLPFHSIRIGNQIPSLPIQNSNEPNKTEWSTQCFFCVENGNKRTNILFGYHISPLTTLCCSHSTQKFRRVFFVPRGICCCCCCYSYFIRFLELIISLHGVSNGILYACKGNVFSRDTNNCVLAGGVLRKAV